MTVVKERPAFYTACYRTMVMKAIMGNIWHYKCRLSIFVYEFRAIVLFKASHYGTQIY
jgi:hypothetical protein